MVIEIPSSGLAFSVKVTVQNNEQVNIPLCILAIDPDKSTDKYTTEYHKRETVLEAGQSRTFELKFPDSPNRIELYIFNFSNGNLPIGQDKSFSVSNVKVEKLKQYDVWWNDDTKSFYKFAVQFAKNASVLKSSPSLNKEGGINQNVATYKSDDGKFIISYYDTIYDHRNKKTSNTPARIGHKTGIIDISKQAFIKMTVPMRLVILLHEYSHKYLNPKIGLKINNESGADVQGLYIYLGKGWSPYEAHKSFLKVFKKANNSDNHKRYLVIKDFITKYENGIVADIKKV